MPDQVIFTCANCGSATVTREAWAAWDRPSQAWVLTELFDHAFCHSCHRRVTLEPQPIEE